MLISSQKMVNDLLNTPKIEEMQALLNTAKPSVTWYGKRIIQIPNFYDSITSSSEKMSII